MKKYLIFLTLLLSIGSLAFAGPSASKAAADAAAVATFGMYKVMKEIAVGDLSEKCQDFIGALGNHSALIESVIAAKAHEGDKAYKTEAECKEAYTHWRDHCRCEYYFRMVTW